MPNPFEGTRDSGNADVESEVMEAESVEPASRSGSSGSIFIDAYLESRRRVNDISVQASTSLDLSEPTVNLPEPSGYVVTKGLPVEKRDQTTAREGDAMNAQGRDALDE